MMKINKEVLTNLQEKHADHLTFGEAGEIMDAIQGGEVMEIIAAAFAYGYEKAQKEGGAND